MSLQDQHDKLIALRAELDRIAPATSSAQFTSWRSRAVSVLLRALGADHHITVGFLKISWTSARNTEAETFSIYVERARGYLEAAADEVAFLIDTASSGVPDAANVDPELWAHVAPYVAAEDWGTVASQTAIFTEDRIRRWTGQPPTNVGEKLMTAALGDGSDYRLGRTSGEKNGWHRFGMGISMALRNADAHRIEARPDHRLYAMGVLGASSLLLTQLRYEHGNRFQDQRPVPPIDPIASPPAEDSP